MTHAALLCSFSFVHCMEISELKNNTNINQTTLQLENSLLHKLIDSNQKKKSNSLLFLQRTKRLNLLQKLLDQKADITFSNEDNDIKFWLNKDENIVTQILHEKLFSLLSYKANSRIKITINHTPFDQQTTFTMALQLNNSLLHITIAKALNYNTKRALIKFLHEYGHNNAQQQRNDQHFVPDQNTINTADQFLQLTEDEYSFFVTLPHNTQELLRDILLDRDGLLQ